MVNFYHIVFTEEQTAVGTFSFLMLQECCHPFRQLRTVAHSCTPVNQVPIERGCCSFDFDMPLNFCAGVIKKSKRIFALFFGCKYPVITVYRVPISVCHPTLSLLRMTVFCPRHQFVVHQVIEFCISFLAYDSCKVVCPAPNNRI